MRRHNDASMLIVFALLAVLSALAPPEPEPEPTPEPPPLETVKTDAAQAVPLEAVAGLAVLVSPFVLIIAARRRKRKRDIIRTDNIQFALLIRRLNDMARIMENVTDSE